MRKSEKNLTSRLQHKVTLQEEVRTLDDVGGYNRSWKDVADLWAEIILKQGKERMFGDKIQSEITHKIRLRYRTGISSNMRFLYEGKALNIRSVINVMEESKFIEVLATQGDID